MNSTLYNIEPITRTKMITKIKIEIYDIVLFTSCQIRVSFYSDDNIIIDNKLLFMNTEDYQLWASDDNYIVEYVKRNINTI